MFQLYFLLKLFCITCRWYFFLPELVWQKLTDCTVAFIIINILFIFSCQILDRCSCFLISFVLPISIFSFGFLFHCFFLLFLGLQCFHLIITFLFHMNLSYMTLYLVWLLCTFPTSCNNLLANCSSQFYAAYSDTTTTSCNWCTSSEIIAFHDSCL